MVNKRLEIILAVQVIGVQRKKTLLPYDIFTKRKRARGTFRFSLLYIADAETIELFFEMVLYFLSAVTNNKNNLLFILQQKHFYRIKSF